MMGSELKGSKYAIADESGEGVLNTHCAAKRICLCRLVSCMPPNCSKSLKGSRLAYIPFSTEPVEPENGLLEGQRAPFVLIEFTSNSRTMLVSCLPLCRVVRDFDVLNRLTELEDVLTISPSFHRVVQS